MLAIVEIVVLTALVIVQAYQVTLHRIVEVLLVHEHVRAEYYLVLLRQEGPLHEAITSFET